MCWDAIAASSGCLSAGGECEGGGEEHGSLCSHENVKGGGGIETGSWKKIAILRPQRNAEKKEKRLKSSVLKGGSVAEWFMALHFEFKIDEHKKIPGLVFPLQGCLMWASLTDQSWYEQALGRQQPTETWGLIELVLELWNSWKYSCAKKLHLFKLEPSQEYTPSGALGPTLSVWCPASATH